MKFLFFKFDYLKISNNSLTIFENFEISPKFNLKKVLATIFLKFKLKFKKLI